MKTIIFLIIIFSMFSFQNTNHHPSINFLHSLNREQINKVQFPFNHNSKEKWHYFPASMVPRAGISLGELNQVQKDLFFDLLSSSLSETGYSKTKQIISLENVLAETSGNSSMRDPAKYFIAFYGNPEKDSLWAWCFQGHHLSINFTVLNGKTEISPRFMGANPAIIKSGKRKGERTLAREEDLGMELINSMSPKQKEKAIIRERAYFDIQTTNLPKVYPLEPTGIKLEELEQQQKTVLLDLINEYMATMPEELVTKRLENLKQEESGEIRFAWAGATQSGEGHYYRIQGKSFLIELIIHKITPTTFILPGATLMAILAAI